MNKRLPKTLLFALALAACHRGAVLDQAAARASPKSDARTLALAGFHAYLAKADPELAQSRFDAALAKDPAEPYALMGEVYLARRRGHPEAALTAALELCRRAPRHPLAAAAARYVLDSSGTAVGLDDRILTSAKEALAAGAWGDAAHLLRSAVATIQGQRSDDAGQDETLAALGIPTQFALWGPFSPFHVLAFDDALPPEKDVSLAASYATPTGPVQRRVLSFPDGRPSLSEPRKDDVYVLATDAVLGAGGRFTLRVVSPASFKVYVDGERVLERRGFERALSTVTAVGLKLGAGRHRLMLKLVKGETAGNFSVALMRQDGSPAGITFEAAFGPAKGLGSASTCAAKQAYPRAGDFAQALAPEAGEVLAAYLAAQDAVGRDRDGAKALLDEAGPKEGPAWSELGAEIALADHTVPTKVGNGRATRDLEAAIARDPKDVLALTALAALALDGGRLQEAADLVQRAQVAHTPVGFPVPLLQARVALAQNVDAEAERAAKDALKAQPGLCDAGGLLYDLARRRDAVADADALVGQTSGCPGSQSRAAEHAKVRGEGDKAIALLQRVLARDPTHIPTGKALVSLYVAQRRFDPAVQLLESLIAQWPYDAELSKKQAEVFEFWGKPDRALAARERALSLDGSDLTLRRLVERARTGKEPLEKYAISGADAIADYEAHRGDEDTASAYILDYAAVQAFPDGSMLDRIHIIQKALDQNGVQEVAEVTVPSGAQVISMRTLKKDGTVLEPETIEDKDSVSMPGVQAGDYVEYEFLEAHPSRGAAEPGFVASNFYFQIAGSPNNRSTYVVVAPKGTGMTVDAHNMRSNPPEAKDGQEVYFHEERRVPPLLPEPNSPPASTEYLPFVAVGAGATGNDGVVSLYADGAYERGQHTYEVEAFARAAVGEKKGLDAVRAVYAAVMQKLQGKDLGLSESAAASVAQDRGSRAWLMKASLEAVGFPTRFVAVRTFAADPAPYKLPDEQLLQYVCLRTELKNGRYVWLDPLVRFAPFGELPEQAVDQAAYLMPEPGRPLERVRTPKGSPELGKEVQLDLQVDAQGRLSGTGTETYTGFDAAQLAEALDELAPAERDQALQRALSRYFGGADLSDVKLEAEHAVGASLRVRYQFTAAKYARAENGRLVLGPPTYPLQLGQRFVQMGSRRTPLFIEATEAVHTQVDLTLPPGYRLSPVPEIKAEGAFGTFVRHERQVGSQFHVEETFRLGMARIPVAQYEDFAQFAGEVDLVQTRDLVAEKK